MLTRRAALALLAAGPVLSLPASIAAASSPGLSLEQFFVGKVRGRGLFHSDRLGLTRHLSVIATGQMSGEELILDEHITYDDGVRDRATWRFRPTPFGYTGQRTGVEGPVPVRRKGETLAMSYVATTPGLDGTPVDLRFDDVLVADGPDRVVNTAVVRAAGVAFGRVEIEFIR